MIVKATESGRCSTRTPLSTRHKAFLALGVLVAVLGTTVFLVNRPTQRPHVVLISIDTLRADHVGAYGYGRKTTPFLDSIAARGAVFEEVIVPSPSTDPSHASMFTGLHPLRHGVLSNTMLLRSEFETVAEQFKAHGYATAASVGVYHLSKRYGFDQGFEQFYQPTEAENRRTADEVNADVFSIIRSHSAASSDTPLFLFVHYFDVHSPYVNRDERSAPASDSSPAAMIDAYDSGIRFVDSRVQQVLGAPDQAGLGENLVTAVTSDHGEQLGEHGYSGGHADIYRETVQVPLILAGPRVRPGRIAQTVSSMNLPTTLLSLAGLSSSMPTPHASLVPLLEGDAEFVAPAEPFVVVGYPSYTRSVALRSGDLYFIRIFDAMGRTLNVGPASPRDSTDRARVMPASSAVVGDARVFTIPPIDFEAFEVTVDIALKAGCAATATLTVPPDLPLLTGLQVSGATRIVYANARLDPTFVQIRPAACAGEIEWIARPLLTPNRLPPVATSVQTTVATEFFGQVLSQRGVQPGNQLFDVVRDPLMLRNLLTTGMAAPDTMVATLRLFFEQNRTVAIAPTTRSPEEIKRLRSLGYMR